MAKRINATQRDDIYDLHKCIRYFVTYISLLSNIDNNCVFVLFQKMTGKTTNRETNKMNKVNITLLEYLKTFSHGLFQFH